MKLGNFRVVGFQVFEPLIFKGGSHKMIITIFVSKEINK
jgi:hypothetical protein